MMIITLLKFHHCDKFYYCDKNSSLYKFLLVMEINYGKSYLAKLFRQIKRSVAEVFRQIKRSVAEMFR